jgi:RHS repeat-associated protein
MDRNSFGAPFTFTGEQTDANGLVYLRARYYDPGQVRWLLHQHGWATWD